MADIGTRDSQTVDSEGRPLAKTIHGVKTRSTPNHVDHRGTVFEVFEGTGDYWDSPVVYAYQFSVRPGLMKGWGLHEHKIDRYTIITGEIMLFLVDTREDSPTRGVEQRVVMSDRGIRQVTIPAHVWHLSVNMTDEEARLVNFPTEVYHHEAPDRRLLPWDTDLLPTRVADYLPLF